MDITGQEYRQMNKQASPKSPVLKNCILAFLAEYVYRKTRAFPLKMETQLPTIHKMEEIIMAENKVKTIGVLTSGGAKRWLLSRINTGTG